jgi:hypothetical protein
MARWQFPGFPSHCDLKRLNADKLMLNIASGIENSPKVVEVHLMSDANLRMTPYASTTAVADRRTHTRIPFDCPARWSSDGIDNPARACDASEADAGFITAGNGRPAVGDRIRLVFQFDDHHEWLVDSNAEVVRCDPLDDRSYHVGVSLTPLLMEY